MPLIRRIPKRGFNSRKRRLRQIVNIELLNGIKSKDIITPEEMKKGGLIKDAASSVKVLGDGNISKAIKVSAHAFSKSAVEKIKKAGGEIDIIGDTSSQGRNSKDDKKCPQKKDK